MLFRSSFKNFDLRKPVRFAWLVVAVLPFVIVGFDPSRALLLCFGSYAVSAPLAWCWRRLRRRARADRGGG